MEFKVFTRRPLHGKTYIFYRNDLNNPITGFVGSSNLTPSGLASNLELNVDVLDSSGGGKDLAQSFEDRWNDPHSHLINGQLLTLLDESWAAIEPRSPYEVFLKVCYDLSRDVREGLDEYSVPLEVRSELLDYQATAVRTLARRVMTRGGTMLGDVVGLGKTITAVAVALMLREEHGYLPLVVCPVNLVKMWRSYFDAYGLEAGAVVPYTGAPHAIPVQPESVPIRHCRRVRTLSAERPTPRLQGRPGVPRSRECESAVADRDSVQPPLRGRCESARPFHTTRRRSRHRSDERTRRRPRSFLTRSMGRSPHFKPSVSPRTRMTGSD